MTAQLILTAIALVFLLAAITLTVLASRHIDRARKYLAEAQEFLRQVQS